MNNVKYKMSRSNGSRKPFESVEACGGAKSVEALAYSFYTMLYVFFNRIQRIVYGAYADRLCNIHVVVWRSEL